MRKVMLLTAMLAMVLAATVPAFAQPNRNQLAAGGQGDDLIQQCQNNLNQDVVQNAGGLAAAGGGNGGNGGVVVSGDGNATGGGGGDASADVDVTNINAVQQNCVNIANSFNEVNIDRDVVNVVGITVFDGVEHTVFFNETTNVFFIVVNQEVIVVERDVVVLTVEEVVSPDVAVVSPDVAVSPPAPPRRP